MSLSFSSGHFKSFRIFVTVPVVVLHSFLTKRTARLCTVSMSFICFWMCRSQAQHFAKILNYLKWPTLEKRSRKVIRLTVMFYWEFLVYQLHEFYTGTGLPSGSCPSTIPRVYPKVKVQPDRSKESSRCNVILLVLLCSDVITHE